MGGQEKLSASPILVRLSDSDMLFLAQFIHECGEMISPPEAFRMFLKYFRMDYEEAGANGCLLKVMGKL